MTKERRSRAPGFGRICEGMEEQRRKLSRGGGAIARTALAMALALFLAEPGMAGPGLSAGPAAAGAVRVAVAPFADEPSGLPLAMALAGRLARRPIERLIAPDAPVAQAEFEPRAEAIRRWAHTVAVDAVVVGRLVPLPSKEGYDAEAIVRSGHSGAEMARHSVRIARPAELGSSAEILAAAILTDLGYRGPDPDPAPDPGSGPPAAVAPSGEGATRGNAGTSPPAGRGGLEAGLAGPGFRGDEPIEIQADEAEIVDRSEGRELWFKDNVHVRQGNVTLRSEWLEAHYRKGESEPRQLIARGDVQVEQGDRQARCDEAIYLREEQRLSCVGHAELIQGCDVVRGDRIEFDLADDRAHVQGAASIVIRSEEAAAACEAGKGSL